MSDYLSLGKYYNRAAPTSRTALEAQRACCSARRQILPACAGDLSMPLHLLLQLASGGAGGVTCRTMRLYGM